MERVGAPHPRAARAEREIPIIVIGGGWAGCAAAVTLAQAGHRVALHEAAPIVGGRARCVMRDGLPLDNGEHVLLGAYTGTLALASAVRDPGQPAAFRQTPLALRPFGAQARHRLSFAVRRAPGPLGLLAGLAGAEGIGALDRARLAAWFVGQRRAGFECDPRMTVAALMAAQPPRLRDELWFPLCLAALNTAPARASAQIFLNVLRETFAAGADATALVTPRAGLGEAVPEACADWLVAHRHEVCCRTRTRVVAVEAGAIHVDCAGVARRAQAVIVAVGPHQLRGAFAPEFVAREPALIGALAAVDAFEYEPITTLYLGYDAPIALPPGLLRLEDGPGQWIFDRADVLERAAADDARPPMRALVSVVISASGEHAALDHDALAHAVDAQLRRLEPALPRRVYARVIDERRATYASLPGLVRPAAGRVTERVYLAGDYTYADYPATLEAAVRSGRIAAHDVMRGFAAGAAARDSIRAP